MNLYIIRQTVNNEYDTYDSAVVAAESDDDARTILPGYASSEKSWCRPDQVIVELIGVAKDGIKRGTIVAAHNAG